MEKVIDLITMMFSVGAISFGGGWSVVGIIQDRLVGGGWIDPQGFAEILTLSQLVPGPVALNSSTLIGLAHGGPVLAVLAAFVLVTPGVIVIVIGRWILKKNIISQTSLVKALGAAALSLLLFTLYRLVHNEIFAWWMIPIAFMTAVLNLKSRLPAMLVVILGIILGIGANFIL